MSMYMLSIDQGTTSTRALLIDEKGSIVHMVQEALPLQYPHPGHVEVDASFILQSTKRVLQKLVTDAHIDPHHIAGIGITNQRETTVIWDKTTGVPIYNGLVWQSRQTDAICEKLKQDGYQELFHQRTGLVIDPYFSGTKIKWILDHVEGAREKAEQGQLLFGTIETWLIWNLTKEKTHVTDVSNASRTLLMNISQRQWDAEILHILNIPSSLLPEIRSSSEIYGTLDELLLGTSIPISGAAGDQQAALFGQNAFANGDAKNTYGTGCFMLMNTGDKPIFSKHGLLTTVAWEIDGHLEYALEGSVFIAGAAIQWLRDGLQVIETANETETIASKLSSTEGVYVVPAFVGLGTPYWNSDVRGAIFGLTRGSGKDQIIRAVLEALAYQTQDLLNVMEEESGFKLSSLKVDGGAIQNQFLMQFQSDITGVQVERPLVSESTALGVAFLAGLAVGFWSSKEEIKQLRQVEKVFTPQMDKVKRDELYSGWLRAVKAAMAFCE